MTALQPLVWNGGIERLQTADTLSGLWLHGYIDGLITANNSSDATNDIDFGSGCCWINDRLVYFSSAITKRLDAAWSAGTGNGGLFSGAKASSTWYHCFAMRNSSTGATDFGFDTSVTGANAPSGWVVRRIWSIQTKSDGVIRAYTQNGDRCTWKQTTAYTSVSAIGASARLLITLTVAIGIQVEPLIAAFYSGSNSDYLYFSSPADQDDQTADYTQGRIHIQNGSIAPLGTIRLLTNTSGQIGIREALGTTANPLWLLCSGYIDSRGKR